MRQLLFIAAYLLFGFASRAEEAKPEIFAPNVISAPVMSTAPTFSADQSAVIFQRSDGHHSRLVEAEREGDAWKVKQELPFDERWNYLEPAWSLDGSYLIFASNRPADGGAAPLDGHWNGKTWTGRGGQLWRSDHTASGWSEPKPLPANINANSSIFEPALTRSGTLYYMQPSEEDGKFHLMRAEKKGDGYAEPEALPFPVNGTADVDVAVAPDDSYILFSSTRDTRTRLVIYVSFHRNGTWTTPKLLPGPINEGSSAMDLHLSPDEQSLYFLRDLVIWQAPVADLVKAARE